MANTILIRRKTTTGAPVIGNMAVGEGTIVIPDDTLYYKKNATQFMVFQNASSILSDANLTGNPTAPTQSPGNNSISVATTAFVQAAVVAAGGGDMFVSNYDSNDDGKVDSADDADSLGGVAAASYATQAFVNQAISDLVGGAPGALDTLNELAAALGDDPNAISTIISNLALKLDSNSTIDGGTIS